MLLELQDKLRSFVMCRRLKADVLPDLPPKIWQLVEMSAGNAREKKALLEEQRQVRLALGER